MSGGVNGVHIVQDGVLSIEVAAEDHQPLLHNLMQLYLYEMSEFDARSIDEHGHFPYAHLDDYWLDQRRTALVARAGRIPAGFALVQEQSMLDPKAKGVRSIAEFFVLRQFRRLGIGRALALDVFRRFPGRWEVRVARANERASAFWRRVIDDYTAGRFVELSLDDHRWRGPVHTFDSSLMVG